MIIWRLNIRRYLQSGGGDLVKKKMLSGKSLLLLSMVRISGSGFLKVSLGTRCQCCGDSFLIRGSSPMLGKKFLIRHGFKSWGCFFFFGLMIRSELGRDKAIVVSCP